MSNATDQARSTRSDARPFAEAFAAADDAFTFGPDAGESRTLTLTELGDVLGSVPPPAGFREADDASGAPVAGHPAAAPPSVPGDDRLLSLDELGEVLAAPVREPEVADFDFGTRAQERARRRTAARLEASPSSRRRISGPAARARSRRPDAHLAEAEASRQPDETGTGSSRLDAARAIPAALRPSDDFLADPDARRTIEITGRPGALAVVPRLRTVEGRPARPRAAVDRFGGNPDRIALWAVLLGILLVLIAFTSGSASAVALPLLAGL